MSYKVIVADNSPSVQKVIQMAFPDRGFEIYPFEDGAELAESLAAINPDAVLVGLSLPGRDGYDIAFFMKGRDEFQKTTIVLIKGTYEPLDADRLDGLEVDKIVQKPFDSEALAETVRDLIDRKKCPATLPEDPASEDDGAVEEAPAEQDETFPPKPPSQVREISASYGSAPRHQDIDQAIDAKVRRAVREEILAMERELEKRMKAAISAEIKELTGREKSRGSTGGE